ncbi:PIN domain-containing protein [Candidatus Albibeggiatoa sp. nov. BB20]|uniref:PIN domain-containing protein n=1 Tax=Candidatus Albibeggiatoa sp. nov. BB20 TaxID=3162723 RepID=UPI0033653F91
MYAIDTNIILRFLTQDDEQQYQKAKHIIQTQEVFIPDTVILEIEWVLRYAYGFNVSQIADALLLLVNAGNIYMVDKNRIFMPYIGIKMVWILVMHYILQLANIA